MNRIAILFIFFLACSIHVIGQDFVGRKRLNGTELFLSIKGKGKTIVVLHGGPGLNHSYFRPYLNDLEKKFRVVYYDQRCSGQSATPPSDSVSMRLFIEDLEAIRKYLKLEQMNIIAHSWGAVLLTHYAVKYPARIKKVMLVSPAMLSREYDNEAALLARQKSTEQDSIDRASLIAKGKNMQLADYEQMLKMAFEISAYDRKNIETLSLNLPANFPDASRTLFTGLMKDPAANTNLYDSLQKLTFPVLIVTGNADITPASSIERLRKHLPLGSAMAFEKSGHFPFVEENKKFVQLAIDYFQRDQTSSKK